MKGDQFILLLVIVVVGLNPLVWGRVVKKSGDIDMDDNMESSSDEGFFEPDYSTDDEYFIQTNLINAGTEQTLILQGEVTTAEPLTTTTPYTMAQPIPGNTQPPEKGFFHGVVVIIVGIMYLFVFVGFFLVILIMVVVCGLLIEQYGPNASLNHPNDDIHIPRDDFVF